MLRVNLLMPHYAPLRRGFSLRGSPAVCREAEKNWGRRSSRPLVARAILRVFGTTNKHHAEQHVGFDGNRDDPFDGLLAARARKICEVGDLAGHKGMEAAATWLQRR